MIICFECMPRTKALLDSMVELGQYKDYGEVISSAVENLSVLQEELSSKGVLVIESKNEYAASRSQLKDGKTSEHNKVVRRTRRAGMKREGSESEASPLHAPARVPEIFLLDGIGESLPSPASPPSDVWVKGQEVPLERWIFGQYNKLLPAKASCRALAHLLDGEPNGVPLEEAALRISEEALTLGSFLAHHDKQNGRARDNALSTAFPSLNREVEKSRLRYANQFVANVNKQGQVSGLLIDLKLINHTNGKAPRLLLTEAGWRFATLPNPILDSSEEGSTEKFTTEERSFLSGHISSSVPAEDFAYRAILSAIAEGANTPDEIDTALQRYISRDAYAHLSKSFFSAQRSGAISRMADLGLVARVRSGVRISYVVTAGGRAFMEAKV